jgi:hypothetical protein
VKVSPPIAFADVTDVIVDFSKHTVLMETPVQNETPILGYVGRFHLHPKPMGNHEDLCRKRPPPRVLIEII